MRIIETITVPEKTVTRVKRLVCDFCKKEAPLEGDSRNAWGSDMYSVKEVTLEYTEGCAFPDFHDQKVIFVDMCPKCFETKFLAWCREQGVEPQTREISY